MITDSRSTRVRFTTTKRESENEIHHRTFRSLLISISPPASKRAYFTLLPLIFADSSSNDGGGQAKRPRPPRSRASGTRRCGRVFGTAIARVLKIPVTTPIDPPPTAPVLIQTPLSLSLSVYATPLQNCASILERARFSKKSFRKVWKILLLLLFFFFFFPPSSTTDDNGTRSIGLLCTIIECSDYRAERFLGRKVWRCGPRNREMGVARG